MKGRILVVDDEADIVDLTMLILEQQGYSVISASNGDDAIEKAASEKPDLILLDLLMPGKDGLEVCRILKRNENTSRIPIIVSSTFSELGHQRKALEAGAVAYLGKPFNFEVMSAEIENALGLKPVEA